MEYFWYVIAALGAGIGTGLAGLSAATVMVPILIVLCPSFAGMNGAYHATAIALASDILGSAVTTSIYIRHKNIDLKRGWIMLVCILSMCIAGSFVAWSAGNVVLGGFSLFLTFAIGIRFLIKPDTQRKDMIAKGTGLDFKGTIISLFFGLTIGFGTGFVGSGGGMMMLVVFTAFLGMELKPAVGTSTFIMTFTALIASVSHMFIDPSIVLERWDALLICVAAATFGSVVSARFANRVSNRIVGLVTGAVLTALGAAMIILNYWDWIIGCTLLWQTFCCFGWYLLYIVMIAAILIVLRFTCRMPREVFRKLLQIPALSSLIVLMWAADNWMAASITAILFAAILYPILKILERFPGYGDLFIQRKDGEVKKSLLLLFLTTAALIAVCWGALNQPYIAIAAIMIWGIGDSAAAIVGKQFGKHPIRLRYADQKKTWEGSGAMFITAFVVGIISLCVTTTLPWYISVLMSLIAAPLATLTELLSHNGNDTVSVPVICTATLYILSMLMV